MPKDQVSDPITDQETAFAHLVLSGTMTDRRAAEVAGLNPDTAAYTKAKPRVRAYMLEHRAAVQQQLVEQDTEELRQFNLSRDQILARLWEIANLDPERTRNSMSAQVKALSMVVAIEGLIPDRRAVSAQNKPAPPPVHQQIDTTAWLREQQVKTTGLYSPDLGRDEDWPGVSDPPLGAAPDAPSDLGPIPSPAFDPSESAFANHFSPSGTTPGVPPPAVFVSTPGIRVPFSREKNPFARRPWSF
jgi:hypothetical protein